MRVKKYAHTGRVPAKVAKESRKLQLTVLRKESKLSALEAKQREGERIRREYEDKAAVGGVMGLDSLYYSMCDPTP